MLSINFSEGKQSQLVNCQRRFNLPFHFLIHFPTKLRSFLLGMDNKAALETITPTNIELKFVKSFIA